jgi:hypothetical protein
MSCRIKGNKKHFFINSISTSQFVGWWVGFGCGWAKLNVLQKRWLVCRLAALLILRSVGVFVVRCQHEYLMLARPPALQVTLKYTQLYLFLKHSKDWFLISYV